MNACRAFLLFACFLAAVAVSSTKTYATALSSISGVAQSPLQAPLAGVEVQLVGPLAPRTTLSASDGRFSFTDLPPGTYILRARAHQFEPASSAPFALTPNQHLDFTIVLQPATTTDITTMGHITVKGKGALNTSGSQSFVISTDELTSSGVLRIDSALDHLPGVTISPFSGGAPVDPTFLSIRGASGFNENLVLQDGEPMGFAYMGGTIDLSTLTPAIYSRVQVVEGLGGTSLFGADAIGGTVNLVTRDPLKSEGGQLLMTAGSYGTSDYNIVESTTIGRLGYLLDLHGFSTDGKIPSTFVGDYLPVNIALGAPPPTSYTAATAVGTLSHDSYSKVLRSDLLKLRYDASQSTYFVLSASDETDFRFGFEGTRYLSPITINGVSYVNDPLGHAYIFGVSPGATGWTLQPKYTFELHTNLGGGNLIVRSYSQWLQQVADYNNAILGCCFVQRLQDHLTGQLVSWTKEFGKSVITIATGGNGDAAFESDGAGLTPLTFSQLTSNIHARQLERTYLIRDDISAGSRTDVSLTAYYSSYDTLGVRRFDPRIAIVNQINADSLWRVSVGSGFAAPELVERILPLQTQFGGFPAPGCPTLEPNCAASGPNPDLRAESAIGVDAAYQKLFGERGSFGVDLYRYALRDHQDAGYIAAPPGSFFPDGTPVLIVLTTINSSRVTYQGLDLSLTLPIASHFDFGADYNTQAAYPTSVDPLVQPLNPQLVTNQQFESIPLHKESASLTYWNRTGTSVDFRWQFYDNNNPYNLPAFSSYDADASLPLNEDVSLHIDDHNMFAKNDFLFGGPFGSGVPYSGVNGPIMTYLSAYVAHSVTATLEWRWGAMRTTH